MTIKERGIILEFASKNAPGPTGSVPPFSALTATAKIQADGAAVPPWGKRPIPPNLRVQLACQINNQKLQYKSAKYLRSEGKAAFFEAQFPNLSEGDKVVYYFQIIGLGAPIPSDPPTTVKFEIITSDPTEPDPPTTPDTETGPIVPEDPILEEDPSDPTTGPPSIDERPLAPPVLLFPLKLETRFVGKYLWIRFVPDPVLINQLIQHASKQELQALSDFETASEEGDDEKAAWRALAQKVGVYRAAWLIHQKPEEATPSDKPVMEIVVLPDAFDISLYTDYDKGECIPQSCTVNCGKTLRAFQEEKLWETDFAEAKKQGLGMEIWIGNDVDHFDRITVVGRQAGSSVKDLQQLLHAHRYTNGVSFLPYGTPTNNTEGEKTPYSSAKRQDADMTYEYLVQPMKEESSWTDTWADTTAKALGLTAKDFKYNRYALKKQDELVQALKTILWWSLGHHTMKLLIGKGSEVYSAEEQEWLWKHYQQYVHAQGPLPAIQVGRNPYGMLPVARTEPREGDDKLFHFRIITQRLLKIWKEMVIDGVPKAGDGESKDVLSALAMQDCSTHHFAQSLMDKDTLIQLLKAQHLGTAFDNEDELVNRFLLINGISADSLATLNTQWENMVNKNKEKIRGGGEEEGILEGYLDNNLNGAKLFELIKEGEPVALTEELNLSLLVAGKEKYLPKLSNTINTRDVTQRKPRPGQINEHSLLSILELLIDRALLISKPKEAQEALRNAITTLDDLSADGSWSKLQQAFTQALDLNAYRLDAWVTSAATRLLAQHRQKDPEGLQLGVFGWVENLKRDDTRAIAYAGGRVTTYRDTYPEDGGGFIHAPSTTQATAAALAKSAFLANQKTEPEPKNAFALNLLSDRIQGAQRLHDGIRHGQDIAALLGYAFERQLHDLGADNCIAHFRDEYPFVANKKELESLNVVDGVKLLENYPPDGTTRYSFECGNDEHIQQALTYINDLKDASADSLHFEALFQAAQGNHERAAAALDAFQGEGTPPILDSLRTPPQGSTLNYKFLYCLSGPDIPRINYLTDDNVRAAAEPVLENWLRKQLGDQEDVTFQVKVTDPDNRMAPRIVDLNLRQLHLGYLDLLMLAETTLDLQQKQEEKENAPQKGISGLEQRVIHFIRKQETELTSELSYKFIPKDSKALKQFWTLLRYLRRFLLTDKSLLPQHILPSSEAERAVYVYSDWYDVYQRVQSTAIFYEQLKEKLDPESGNYAPAEFARSLERVARFGIKEADRIFGEKNPEAIAPAVCKAMTNAYTAYEAAIKKCKKVLDLEKDIEISSTDEKLSPNQYKNLFDHLDTAAKALFGPAFRIIRPVRFPKDLDDFLQKEQEALIGFKPTNRNGQERIREWLQGLVDIYPEMKTYEDAQLLRSAWGKSKEDYTLQIAQYTPVIEHREKYPWVALNKDERAKINGGPPHDEPPYPPGTFSMVIEGPENFKWEDAPLYLLPIWEGRDAIPQTTRNTGISFQYDAPNAEPPQSLLLAVPEPGQTDWNKDDLRDIVNDTLDLAKARLVDIDALKELGFLFPATLININTNESTGETPPPKPPFGAIQVLPWEGTGNLPITDKDDVVVEVAPNDKQMYLKLSGGPGKVAISLYGTDQGLVRNQMITLPQRKEYTIPIRNRNIRYLQFKRVAGRQSITLTKIDHR